MAEPLYMPFQITHAILNDPMQRSFIPSRNKSAVTALTSHIILSNLHKIQIFLPEAKPTGLVAVMCVRLCQLGPRGNWRAAEVGFQISKPRSFHGQSF